MADSTLQLILAWLRAQWIAMAEQLDDFICSFDPPVPEGMDALTVVVLGWVVFCSVLALLVHFLRVSKGITGDISQPVSSPISSELNTRRIVSSGGSESGNAAAAASVPNYSKGSGIDSVDPSFISRVQSSVPFKEAVASRRRSPSPTRIVKIPYVSGAPVASGASEDGVLWVNNVINWIYGRAEVRNNISQAWLAALNSHAMKLSKEVSTRHLLLILTQQALGVSTSCGVLGGIKLPPLYFSSNISARHMCRCAKLCTHTHT